MEDESKEMKMEETTGTAEAAVQEPAAEAAEAPAADTAKAAEVPAADTAKAAEAPAADTAKETAGEAAEESPVTMDDLKDELDASLRRIHEGDVLTGKVVSVSDDEVLVDFNYYAPGVLHREDASDDPDYTFAGNIEQGQDITVTVVKPDDGAGRILLSRKNAALLEAWDRLRELKKTQENVTVKISGITKGGAIAILEGVRGFIPASKLALNYVDDDTLQGYLNTSIEVRVIDADQGSKHLVLSAKDILREKRDQERAQKISAVQVGSVMDGKVETIKPYGAFIDLGDGLSGLLHVSQISNRRIKTPAEVLKEGDQVKVKVIANRDGKLSLSMKALEDAPAEYTREEKVEIPKSESIGTSLGDLLKGIKL